MFKKDGFKKSGLHWLWIAFLIIFLDQLSKYFALKHLTEYDPLPITRFFSLTLAFNKGAAFSLLNDASGWQTWFFGIVAIVISLGILFWLSRISAKDRLLSIALVLIAGGALGNLIDRIYLGHVIDFIDWHVSHYHWPIFNIADMAVCLGALMLFWESLFKKSSSK
jgi:signal peptidase II